MKRGRQVMRDFGHGISPNELGEFRYRNVSIVSCVACIGKMLGFLYTRNDPGENRHLYFRHLDPVGVGSVEVENMSDLCLFKCMPIATDV